MIRTFRHRIPFPVLLAALALAPTAAAADTGLYARASLTYDDSRGTTFRDRNCEPPAGLAAYFGCVAGDDGRPIGARGDFGSSLGGEIALGWRPGGGAWRLETFAGYQPDFDFRGNANFIGTGASQPVHGSVRHRRLGLRGYFDLASPGGSDYGRFEPWLGAGIAVVRNRADEFTYAFPGLANQPALTVVPGATETGVGWSVSAGTGIRIAPHKLIDIGLTYSDHGRVHSARGEIDIVRGGNVIARVPVEETRAQLRTWGLGVGLRVEFQ